MLYHIKHSTFPIEVTNCHLNQIATNLPVQLIYLTTLHQLPFEQLKLRPILNMYLSRFEVDLLEQDYPLSVDL
jgi:hypothetical protein